MNDTNIIDVNESDFEKDILQESVNKLVVVDFWAPWCGPCKQLTPILEKVISASPEKILLAKVNIDENQQIASQLKIQSIPAVFAFKDKQFVNAFQGVIPEKEIINFLEKCLGEKLENNFDEFYEEVQSLLSDEDFNQAKTMLEDFISKNTKEVKGICFYADCLISLNEVEAANELLKSLDDELLKNDSIQKILKRLELVNQKNSGPSLGELKDELSKSPENVEIVLKIAENYFANNEFDEAFEMLLKYYPKNKEVVKEKLLNFFDVLGFKHESVSLYRKKLSSMMFS
jgi:putative thioredoxin